MPRAVPEPPSPAHRPAARQLLWWLLGGCALMVVLGMLVGSTGIDGLARLWRDASTQKIVFDIRLPRTLGSLLAGGLLGLAGCVAQGLFRNPLADPYLLGSSSGAALGVALAMAGMGRDVDALSWLAHAGATAAAFVGAIVAVVLTLILSRGAQTSLRLLLAGVIVGVVLGACKDIVLLLHRDITQGLQSFTLGSTSFVGWAACGVMALTWAFCLSCACILSRALDALVLGEATARTLGIPLAAMQVALVAVLALATAAAVAQTGLLAFIGLAAPHLVRSAVQVRHRMLLLLSSLTGAVLLGAADLVSRWIIAPEELPVGILTAILGGGYLLYLMHRRGLLRSATTDRGRAAP